MSKIKIQGNASGTGVLTIEAPNTNVDRTITLPDVTGTLLSTVDALPSQTGNSGKYLQTDGTDATWEAVGGGGVLINTQYFTSSGTYTATTGTSYVVVEVVGGGGGGGGASVSNGNRGNGGGGGGYARKTITSAFSGVTATIGAGGGSASAGGTSSFGAIFSATGGGGGSTNSGAYDSAIGGIGSSGDLNIMGGIATRGSSIFTVGASSFYAPTSRQPTGVPSAGASGELYGGGGSGAYTQNATFRAGGSGGAGIIIIHEYS